MVIRFEDVSYVYPGSVKPALDGVSLSFEEGTITAVMGRGGSGKSTLLGLINALRLPSSGDILFDGKSVREADRRLIREKVGLVFQYPEDQLFEKTVLDDVAFGPRNRGKRRKDAERDAAEALEKVKIPEEVWHRSPFRLSGGEKRRVALAGILALKGEVLVLDEISSSFDGKTKKDIFDILKNLRDEGKSVIFTTHDREEAAEYGDETVLLENGRVAVKGKYSDVSGYDSLYMTQGEKLRIELEKRGIKAGEKMESYSDALKAVRAITGCFSP